ncbi:MAG: EutP/PduV family microcompartment system protein [Eubacterium sp.]|nr:EutP/PduV family microcompartment system protein [Eubacterium sp.]
MRRMLLIGRSECGKTTLKQVLRGERITYKKTQYVSQYDCIIDMPGEYAENIDLSHAIDLYAAESDVVAIVLSATEPYSLYPPNVTPLGNRDEIGIVTKIDHFAADPKQAEEWLRLTGCKKIFHTSSYTGEGIEEILEFLKEEHEKCPVTDVMKELHKESFKNQANLKRYHLQ